MSCGDLVLVCESTEDLFPADPVLGEVDLRWPGAGLSRRELAERTEKAGLCCSCRRYSVSTRRRWCSLTISTRSKSSRRRVPIILSQIAFAPGACGGLARILMPSAVNTASKEAVNWPARSLIRNLTEVTRAPRSIRKSRAAWVVQVPSGFAVSQVNAAGAVRLS
jgi:hypothetical protein